MFACFAAAITVAGCATPAANSAPPSEPKEEREYLTGSRLPHKPSKMDKLTEEEAARNRLILENKHDNASK